MRNLAGCVILKFLKDNVRTFFVWLGGKVCIYKQNNETELQDLD